MYYGNYPMYPQNQQRITAQQAEQIALGTIPGQVMHVDLDMDNGILKYEIFIMTPDNRVFEVEINARNGQILKIEQEDSYNGWD